ncbi:hypothetical protein BKA69DRAFT_219737 [Paraphysoderma sedebokerense]|nr:hypothetical protein BKA69DRAFT_219737 [Paraphysoderma sedebokerense]
MSSPTNATSPRPRKLIPPGRSRRGSSLNQPPPNLSALSIPTLPFVNNDVFELNSATIEKLKTLNRSSSDSAVLEIYDSEPTAEAVSTLRSLITTKEDELKLSAEIGQELLWKFQSVVTAYQTLATHYTELELKYKETVDEKEILVAEKAGLLKKLNDVRSHLSSTESSLIDIRESTSTKITQATAILQDTQNRETELLRTVSDLEEKANKAMKEEAKSKKDLKKWKEKCDRFQQRDTDLQEKVKSVQEINRKLRDEVAKLTHQANLSFPSPTPSQPDELTQLVTIIQELQSSNFKIKSEYSQLEELLTEYRNEIASLQAQMEEKETLMIRDDLRSVHDLLGKKVDGGAAFGVETNWDGARHDAVSSIDQSPTRAVDNTGHVSPRSPRSRESPTKELGDTSSVMSSSFGNSLYQQTLNEELSMHSYSNVDEESVADPRSPSKQLFDINSKPHTDVLNFDVILTILTNLHTHALSLLKRLSATDTVTLNRRLKRAFDIDDLTKMSNELIENVRIDQTNFRNPESEFH